jgi:ligand-binding sensor domain-containing protein
MYAQQQLQRIVDWVGTKDGLVSFDDTQWKHYTISKGLINNEVNALAIDVDGGHLVGCGSDRLPF